MNKERGNMGEEAKWKRKGWRQTDERLVKGEREEK